MNHLLPSDQTRFKVRSWNVALRASNWASGATLDCDNESNPCLRGGTEAYRFKQFATLSRPACALEPLACFEPAIKAQVQMQSLP